MADAVTPTMNESIEAALTEGDATKEQATAPTPEAKVDSGTPAQQKPPEDPEFDFGVDEKGQPLKFKKSQVLEFRKGSMLQSDYTKKTQEIAAQREELKEMFSLIEHLKANPKKAERIIKILDEKEEQAQEKVDELEDVLKTLDPNDPYAKTLMALRAQNQQLLKSTQDMQTRLNSFEQKTQTIEQAEATKQAESVLQKALDDTATSLKFDDDADKSDWRKAVLTFLVNNPKKYNNEGEFLAEIGNIGNAEYDALVKRNERITARYIKSKGTSPEVPAHPSGGGGAPLSRKPSLGGKGTENNLQEVLEEAFHAEAKSNPRGG